MHQVAMSSARFNGADLGIRQHCCRRSTPTGSTWWWPGMSTTIERTFSGPRRPARQQPCSLRPPAEATRPRWTPGTAPSTSRSAAAGIRTRPRWRRHPPNGDPDRGAGPGGPQRQRRSVVTTEPDPWSAYRDAGHGVRFRVLRRRPHRAGRHYVDLGHVLRRPGGPRLAYAPARPVRHAQAGRGGQALDGPATVCAPGPGGPGQVASLRSRPGTERWAAPWPRWAGLRSR